jgi:hypothetical protein
MIPCPYCLSEDKLVSCIKRAIVDARKDKKEELANKLQAVLNFLPEWPVMAILEAEALELNENFILMIQDSFNVLPMGDINYKNVMEENYV